jgi:DNA-binding NtrC family response regulator
MSTCTVVIVDDDEALNECVRVALMDQGYRVMLVSDARRMIEVLRVVVRPCVVVLDVTMGGGLDGRELLALLGASPGLSAIPVILTTAARGIRQTSRVRAVLEKPYLLTELLGEIEQAFGMTAAM